LQIVLFMRTFIFSAHDGARLMKADLEHDHYQAGALHGPQEDPKHLWQTVTVGSQLLLLYVFCHYQAWQVAWATKQQGAEMSQLWHSNVIIAMGWCEVV
jgi:hypothetical protein